MDGLNEKFGRSLKAIRKQNGWSQEELAKKLHTTKQVISKYENSQRSPNIYVANEYARVLGVSLEEMLDIEKPIVKNVLPLVSIESHRIPVVGSAAAGEPIFDAELDVYVDGPLKADCAIRVKGDSMNPTYLDGDLLYIRSQPDIDHDGQIAVVVFEDEACVKHIYRQPDGLLLVSDNPAYAPILRKYSDYDNIRVIGKIIGFTRMYSE